MYYRMKENRVYDYSDKKYLDTCIKTDLCSAEEYRKNPDKYIVDDIEEEIEVFDYETKIDEEGNEYRVKTNPHTEKILQKGLVLNPEWETIKAQKEKEKIMSLTCTKRIFALILQEKGVGYSQLKKIISENEQAQLEWELCEKLERSNPLFDVMSSEYGFSPEDIDEIFIKANM